MWRVFNMGTGFVLRDRRRRTPSAPSPCPRDITREPRADRPGRRRTPGQWSLPGAGLAGDHAGFRRALDSECAFGRLPQVAGQHAARGRSCHCSASRKSSALARGPGRSHSTSTSRVVTRPKRATASSTPSGGPPAGRAPASQRGRATGLAAPGTPAARARSRPRRANTSVGSGAPPAPCEARSHRLAAALRQRLGRLEVGRRTPR